MRNVALKSAEQSVYHLVSSARTKQAPPNTAKNDDWRVCKDKGPLSNILNHNILLFCHFNSVCELNFCVSTAFFLMDPVCISILPKLKLSLNVIT